MNSLTNLWQDVALIISENLFVNPNAEYNPHEMNSQASVLPADEAKPENSLNGEDSDSTPERPTTLSFETNHFNHDSNEEAGENDSLGTEDSSIKRSTVSSVERSGKFRLRDISPSRLREKHKSRSKKLDKETKSASSPRKNVRSTTSSWLPASFQQMFPSYKSKAGDFKRIFKNVPETERLITDYSCALQRDILVHGRLYVSQSWLCFYANIFGWETLVTIPLNHVTSMTKEKTALVIPNAIQVWTESEKYFFTSFVSRDSTFRSLFRIWQNVLSDEPELAPALMKAVGKYLDVDSEEQDNSSRGSNEDLPSDFEDIIVDDEIDDDSLVDSEEPQFNDSPKGSSPNKAEEANKTMEDSRSISEPPDIAVSPASPVPGPELPKTSVPPKVTNGTVPRRKTGGTPELRRRFPFPFKKDLSPLVRRKKHQQAKKRSGRESIADSSHRDSLIEEGSLSDSNDSDTSGPILCPCESHFNLELINEEYANDVDTVYEYLFTDCDFYRSVRAARKDFDLDIEPWTDEGEKKKRAVRYTINLNMTLGPKTSKIVENQELKANEPGQYYVVESSVINEGIPYSESFVIVQRYCMTRVNSYMCRLRVSATVKYIRPVWGFVKNMITRNSTEGLSSFFDFLKDYLHTVEDESVLRRRRLNSSRKRPTGDTLEDTLGKRHEEGRETGESSDVQTARSVGRISLLARRIWRDNSWFLSFFTLLLILLVLLNVYLSYRVMSLERSTQSWEGFGLPTLPSEWPSNIEDFRNLLNKQQYLQSVQLRRWQQVLSTSMEFLQQVQASLKELQEEVEKPLGG